MKKKTKIYVGGQAVIEGVMMRGPKVMATAVRTPTGEIVVDVSEPVSLQDRFPILKKPFLRGTIALYESLVLGMKSLGYSAKAAGEEDEEMTNTEIAMTMVFSTVVAILLFLALPTYAAKWLVFTEDNHFMLNLMEGIIRLLLFLLYIWGISRTKDIARVFQYHGAEHKTIHAYEYDEELTVENVKKYTRIHPRCGTNFLMIVMVVSILVFAFLGWPSLWERIVSRVLLMPVVAGIAYEVIRLAGRTDSQFVHSMIAPGLWLQRITTNEPDDDQIEVAIRALEAVRPDEKDAYEEE